MEVEFQGPYVCQHAPEDMGHWYGWKDPNPPAHITTPQFMGHYVSGPRLSPRWTYLGPGCKFCG